MANTYKALQTVTVGAGGVASVSFTNIPQTYTDLVIKTSYRTNRNAAADTLRIAFNNSTTYNIIYLYGNGTGTTGFSGSSSAGIEGLWGNDDSNTANIFGNSELYIPNYVNNNAKVTLDESATENNATLAYIGMGAGISNSTSPITSITLTSNTSSTIKQYSTFTLYGVFNADVSSAPATPTIGTATAGGGYVNVTFTGVSNAASYTVTSTPSSITATGTTSPIQVPVGTGGLTSGTSYTFTVKANNPLGSSSNSAASNSVTAVNTRIVTLTQDGGTNGQYSDDRGITWNNWTKPYSGISHQGLGPGAQINYGNGRFVLIPMGTNNAYYSTNGITYTSAALPYSNFQGSTIQYTPGYGFWASSMYDSNRSVKSTDGITWTAAGTQTSMSVLFGMGYVASVGRWYASQHNDPTGGYTSTWAGAYTYTGTMSGSPYFGSMGCAASNGTTALHVANYSSGTQLWYTTTGTSITYTTLASTVGVGSQIYGYEIGTYLALGNGTTALTSTNGTSWTSRTKNNTTPFCYAVYAKDIGFVSIPFQSTTATAYSSDGITWTTGGSMGIAAGNMVAGQVLNYSQTTV